MGENYGLTPSVLSDRPGGAGPSTVASTDDAGNTSLLQVVGSKADDEVGTSLYAKAYRLDRHDHSPAKCYPTLAPGVSVVKSATPYILGAFAVLVPANTIPDYFDIHGINFDDLPTAGVYELVLYAGPNGGEVEIGRNRFTRLGSAEVAFEAPFMCPIQAPNTQIKAKVAGSNSSASTVTVSLRYHTY